MRWRRHDHISDAASSTRSASITRFPRHIERAIIIGTDSAPGSVTNSPAHHATSNDQPSTSHAQHGDEVITPRRRKGIFGMFRRNSSMDAPPLKSDNMDKMDNKSNTSMAGKYYKDRTTLAERREETIKIQDKFPGKVMVILERYKKEKDLPGLDRIKFLVPQQICMSQFTTIIRNRMNLGRSQSIYFLVANNTMVGQDCSLCELYATHHDRSDGFLYMKYASQEVFG